MLPGRSLDSNNPVILALDTSSKRTSIALARGERVIVSFSADLEDKRSEKLWLEIDFLLGDAGLTPESVDLYAVCTGPGAFTGLRVGIAAVKGIAVAAGKPVAGITSLEAVALLAATQRQVCSIIGAYKGEVYSQLFSFDDKGAPVPENAALVSTIKEAVGRVKGIEDLVLAGHGAVEQIEQIEKIREGDQGGWRLAPYHGGLAECVARLAYLRFIDGKVEKPENLRACYVRPSEAEIKLSQGLLGSRIKRTSGR